MLLKTEDFIVEEIEIEEGIYVYDIEVEDNHNFFANDILVHNSNYYYFEPYIEKQLGKSSEELNDDELVDFLKNLDRDLLGPLIQNYIDYPTKILNSVKNVMSMKQEAVARYGLYYAKKMYTLTLLENEGIRYHDPYYKITGLAIKKMLYAPQTREWMKELSYIISNGKYMDFHNKFIEIERKFYNAHVDDIAFIKTVNYETSKNVWRTIEDSGIPIQVKAALIYNNLIDKIEHDKYNQPIQDGEKIKFIYLKEEDKNRYPTIGWPNREIFKNFIYDIKLDSYIDYDTMFDKTVISSIKNLVKLRKLSRDEVINIFKNDFEFLKNYMVEYILNSIRVYNSLIRKYNKGESNIDIDECVKKCDSLIDIVKIADECRDIDDIKKIIDSLGIDEFEWILPHKFKTFENNIKINRVRTKEEREIIERERERLKVEREKKKAKTHSLFDLL